MGLNRGCRWSKISQSILEELLRECARFVVSIVSDSSCSTHPLAETDALVWVVDSTDSFRLQDCKQELHALLQEQVGRLSKFGGSTFI